MSLNKALLTLALFVGVFGLTANSLAHAAEFKKGEVTKVTGGYCLLVKNKWTPGKKSGSGYAVDKKAKAGVKAACKALLSPAALKKTGMTSIPDTSSVLSSNNSSSSAVHRSSVSGTPPLLTDLPGNIKATFWRPGVIEGINSGSPTEAQCHEFFAGTADGQSGGMGACYLAQGVGYSFQSILESGTSLCYMKNFPTAVNVASGGVTVTRGSPPGGNISQIFSVPNGSAARTIQVSVSGFEDSRSRRETGRAGSGEGAPADQTVYIRVDSAAANARNGNQYGYSLWFCEDGNVPTGYERTTVSLSGEYRSKHTDRGDGGTFSNDVRAFLRNVDGELVFDTSRPRKASVTASRSGEESFRFKSDVVVTADNLIQNKVYDIFRDRSRKAYSVAEFTGAGIGEFRFLQGAYGDLNTESGVTLGSFESATEYRDSYYAAAPESELVDDRDALDISADSFYNSAPDADFDAGDLSCSALADLAVTINMTNSTVRSSVSHCEGERLEGMDFCRSDEEVALAERNFFSSCAPQHH